MTIYANRRAAGRLLGARLERYRDEKPVVLALPRGGVPVGLEIANRLEAPLDIVLVRKIGAPGQPELALAAVVDGERPEVVYNDRVMARLPTVERHIEAEKARQLAEIERRRARYLKGRRRVPLAGRSVILVDDGIATGATVRAAILALRRAAPRRLIVAVPVAPAETVAELGPEVDDLVCLQAPEVFFAIGEFYADFHQLTDDEVVRLLAERPYDEAAGADGPAAGSE